ncbi:MAG: hypothetical protein FWE23_06955 [Chitinivibrionia bacterium]|nr:hypothetical protein [Chitinivibrionia bacterium]
MKKFVLVALMIAITMVLFGCASGPEARGEAAWREAMRAPENSTTRLVRQREAYVRFREAFYAANEKGRITPKLLNNYLMSAIVRAEFIFNETQSPHAPAVKIIRDDIETALKMDGVSNEVRDAYARFLVSIARHHYDQDGVITRAITELEAARTVAANSRFVDVVIADMKNEFAQIQILTAQNFIAEAQRSRQPLDFIRAEYYARVVQHFAPENEEARRILGETRRELVQFLTAFEAAITDYPDTALFRQINSDGVIMAVQSVSTVRGETVLAVELHNASFANIIPQAGMFKIVLADGTEIPATSITFERRAIQQRHTVAGRLNFRGNIARNNIARVEFQARLGDENAPLVVGTKFLQ